MAIVGNSGKVQLNAAENGTHVRVVGDEGEQNSFVLDSTTIGADTPVVATTET